MERYKDFSVFLARLTMYPLTIENPQNGVKKQTILIVEDNALNMMLLNDLLEVHGYSILKTDHGVEALAMAREYHPDLILLDLQLPDISGLEVAHKLKDDPQTRGIPIVAVTAFAMPGDEDKALEAGCDGYIAKPISVHGFLGTVRTFLSRSIP